MIRLEQQATGEHSPTKPSLIFASLEDWDEIWRRNQFLCAGYVDRRPGSTILFIAPPIDVSHAVRTGKLQGLFARAVLQSQCKGAITVLRPIKWWPQSLWIGRKLNELACRIAVRKAARKLSLVQPLLWINDHSAAHLCGKVNESAVIYDITDDWTNLSQSRSAKQQVMKQDLFLCREADQVIVCSPYLHRTKKILADTRLTLIPNGVDAAHYGGVLDGPPMPRAETKGWERPVLGYTGTIHPDRLDVALVRAVAKQMERGTIVLLGPCHLKQEDKDKLRETHRVRFVDAVPYRDVPTWMTSFDLCFVPHLVTPFTESLNPIKLWEYLAAGKPIVSTPVAGFRDYPDLVYLAQSAPEVVKAITLGLDETASVKERRRQEARRNSWNARLDQVDRIIDEARQSGARREGP